MSSESRFCLSLCRTGLLTTLLAFVFLSTSCIVMPTNTHRDQKRSLAKYDSLGIDAPVTLPELKNRTDKGFSAADFLTLHSGLIVSGKYIDEDFKSKLATSREAQEGVLELGFSVPIAKGGSGFGSCAPVTSDGYFLTAAHVLAHKESYVLYATSSKRKTFIDYAPVRVVYRNDAADFAIDPQTYASVYRLRSWTERLGEVLAALDDRLHTPTAAAVAARLTQQHSRHDSRPR